MVSKPHNKNIRVAEKKSFKASTIKPGPFALYQNWNNLKSLNINNYKA